MTELCFLCCQIQEMMRENENVPNIERLEQHEFNLDFEEQRRLEAMVEQEVTRVNHTHTHTQTTMNANNL